jgi:hypothetical protein
MHELIYILYVIQVVDCKLPYYIKRDLQLCVHKKIISIKFPLASSVKVTIPLVEHIISQTHLLPDEFLVRSLQQEARSERAAKLNETAKNIRETAPPKTKRVLDLTAEKGSSAWLTVFPIRDMGFNLNKREFCDAVQLRYEWPVANIPSTCACGDVFTVDHAMICKRGGFVIQRHKS